MAVKQKYNGLGASAGIAIGKAFVLPTWEWELPDTMSDVTDLANEFERLYAGIRTSKHEIRNMKKEVSESLGYEESNIFDAHLAILDDPVFMSEIQGIIQRQYKAAEVAVKEVIDNFVNMFDLLEDEYMRERALDIRDVGNRLLKHLIGTPEITLPTNAEPMILVAHEVSPSQLAHLNPSNVIGVITVIGGVTSHSAIMARAMGIPFITGVDEQIADEIQTGDLLVIDGEEGIVYPSPDEDTVEYYETLQSHQLKLKEKLEDIAALPTQTIDGQAVTLEVNITSEKEVSLALEKGAEGVGLFRTEVLYMDRNTLPTEMEQFYEYKKIIDGLGDRPFVIRTLDIGADKRIDYIPLPEEDNPVVGYRGIRISLDRKDLFVAQLKAILRTSHYGNVKILYPMISSVEEVRQANEMLEEAKHQLREAAVPFDENIEVGAMIEVPAAALLAEMIASEVQFFSIGTNDLIQYILAVDRMNEKIAHMYDPFHPAVIRMLKMIFDAAKRANIRVTVCGEMAGDLRATPIWIGLGSYNLSMSLQSILPVKSKLLSLRRTECEELVERILRCETSADVRKCLYRLNDES